MAHFSIGLETKQHNLTRWPTVSSNLKRYGVELHGGANSVQLRLTEGRFRRAQKESSS
jgi:hypothetical protein